ncbi:MAG: hypothetical protein HUN04_05905 [Desulfobacter sp.]|nr:MAG: hypothetical protein HUN04_05905 [Desulfobacter sp.]
MKQIFGMMLVLFTIIMMVVNVNAESLAELEKRYNSYKNVVLDSNALIIPDNYTEYLELGLTGNKCFTDLRTGIQKRHLVEEQVMECVMSDPMVQHRAYDAFMFSIIAGSNSIKNDLIKNDIPELQRKIAQLKQQQKNGSNSDGSFRETMDNLTSDSHLSSTSFSNIESVISGPNQSGTSISSSQISSFDRGWDDTSNSGYGGGCPKVNPGSKTQFKLYPNGQNSGRTYLLCGYFRDGDINFEKPYRQGKVDGKFIAWSKTNGTHYVRERSNWLQGKLSGLKETYLLSKTGAVYRQKMMTYANGIQHGDSASWYDNGHTQNETNYFNGKATLQYNYNRDGSFSYCTKWGSDGRPRDCKTGKLR